MMTALLLAGCTADDETAVQQEDTLQLAAYTRNYVDLTRGVPDGYETFVPDDVTSIGIFLTPPDDDKPLSLGYFSYNGHYWRSNISVKSHDYYIYGFMPGDVISKSACSVSMLEGKTSFEDGAILTLDGLKPISKSDVCVVVGVQAVTSSSPDVKLGQFKYEYLGQAKGEHFVNLLMDHIYSCLQFRMSVDEDYAKVRTIKLKRMELKTAAVSGTKAVITLIANTSGNNPISKISWTTPAGGTGMSTPMIADTVYSKANCSSVSCRSICISCARIGFSTDFILSANIGSPSLPRSFVR